MTVRHRITMPLLIVIAAAVIAALLIINRPEPEQSEFIRKPLLINAIEAQMQAIQIPVHAQGSVTPHTQTTLIAEVAGTVVEVSENFKAGGFFRKGEVLLRIDDRDYLANLKRAEAAVASARSHLASERGRAEVAYQDWLKFRSNVKRSEEATALALRKPQLADAQAKLDAAIADLNRAKNDLDRTTLRAPYNGLVREKFVDVGQYVTSGAQLVRTFAVDYAEIRLPIPESKIPYLDLPSIAADSEQKRPAVTLSTQIGQTTVSWPSRLVRTEGVFDERTRVLYAVAQVDDPYGLLQTQNETREPLRFGTFISATIEGHLFNDMVVLPRHILRAGNRIWVIDEAQKLQNREVEVLQTGGQQVYVQSGLKAGELISLSIIPGAVEGTEVRVSERHLSSEFLPNEAHTPNTEESSESASNAAPSDAEEESAPAVTEEPAA